MKTEERTEHILKLVNSKAKKITVLYRFNNIIFTQIFPNERCAREFRELMLIKTSTYKTIEYFKCESRHRYQLLFHKYTQENKKITNSLIVDSKKEAIFAKKSIEKENLGYKVSIKKLY